MNFLNASDAKPEFVDLLIKVQCLRVVLQQGIDEVEAGRQSKGDDVIERLRARIA